LPARKAKSPIITGPCEDSLFARAFRWLLTPADCSQKGPTEPSRREHADTEDGATPIESQRDRIFIPDSWADLSAGHDSNAREIPNATNDTVRNIHFYFLSDSAAIVHDGSFAEGQQTPLVPGLGPRAPGRIRAICLGR